jgi:hypothetical protein
MIKSLIHAKNGSQLVMLGLAEENIKRLKSGDPVYLHLDELGIEGIDVLIHYGITKEAIIKDLQDKGLLPDDN